MASLKDACTSEVKELKAEIAHWHALAHSDTAEGHDASHIPATAAAPARMTQDKYTATEDTDTGEALAMQTQLQDILSENAALQEEVNRLQARLLTAASRSGVSPQSSTQRIEHEHEVSDVLH